MTIDFESLGKTNVFSLKIQIGLELGKEVRYELTVWSTSPETTRQVVKVGTFMKGKGIARNFRTSFKLLAKKKL